MNAPIFNVHDLVLSFAILECFILALSRYLLPSDRIVEKRLLIATILTMAFYAITIILKWNPYFRQLDLIPEGPLVVLSEILVVSRAILLYLYISASVDSDFRFFKSLRKHSWALIFYLVVIILFWIKGENFSVEFTTSGPRFISKLIGLAYAFFIIHLILDFQKRLKSQCSNYDIHQTVWLWLIGGSAAFNWSWSTIVLLSGMLFGDSVAYVIGTMINWSFFINVNFLFLYTIVYTNKLIKLPSTETDDKKTIVPDYDINKVLAGAEEQKLYLEPGLTLDEYASKIKLPPRTITTVLNRIHQTNFYEFINKYRVEHAKRLLSSPEHARTSVLDILYNSGFNNKTTFHRNFNRLVGMSPTEYRKKEIRKSHKSIPV